MGRISTVQKIIDAGEALGWTVQISKDDRNTRTKYIYFEKMIDEQDVITPTFTLKGADVESFCKEFDDYMDGYDADYEAYLWIGEDGHGKNGAPYHIKDIVNNMDKREDEYEKLLDALKELY